VVLDKVATTIEARAAKGAKAFTGEAATTAATGGLLDKVATTAIKARKPSSRAKTTVVKRVAAKKRAAPKKKANTKRTSRRAAKARTH
jgi:hypothetical protein